MENDPASGGDTYEPGDDFFKGQQSMGNFGSLVLSIYYFLVSAQDRLAGEAQDRGESCLSKLSKTYYNFFFVEWPRELMS